MMMGMVGGQELRVEFYIHVGQRQTLPVIVCNKFVSSLVCLLCERGRRKGKGAERATYFDEWFENRWEG